MAGQEVGGTRGRLECRKCPLVVYVGGFCRLNLRLKSSGWEYMCSLAVEMTMTHIMETRSAVQLWPLLTPAFCQHTPHEAARWLKELKADHLHGRPGLSSQSWLLGVSEK